jgi:NAD(P)-dependent dehydrogenase (short-subunit alcohol dehydrogenase family)
MKEFKGKVAVVTGAANGIGRAFSEEAAKRGMKLALIDIDTDDLAVTKEICEKAGAQKVITIKTDVSKYEEVRFSIMRVMQEYGGIDVMYNNAGIATAGWVYDHPAQDWAWAMNVNVLGMAYYAHEVLPIFKKQGTPCHYLFTASIAGLIGGLRYNTAYLASKHAAVCIAESVKDLANAEMPYMGVSVFCPEYIHTDIHNSEDHRPAEFSKPCDPFYESDSYKNYREGFKKNITEKGMNPAFVGPRLFLAIEENHMYIVPHMHTHEEIRSRNRAIEADLEREEALNAQFEPLQKY